MVDPNFPVPPPPDLAGAGSSRVARVATTVALMLMIIGGFNWALVGLFNMDFVAALFGPMTVATRTVYVAVGVAALYGLTLLPRLGQGSL
jgi:uncharacterized membrane protein YuzA (DUF378 family)